MKKHILKLSTATNFDEAKAEWSLYQVRLSENSGRCPCGVAIKEHCYLENSTNAKRTWVGNVCVKNFMGIDSGNLFPGLRKLRSNATAKPNTAVIEYAWKARYIYDKREYDFLMDIRGKRKLTDKQLYWLRKINRRIVEAIVVNHAPDQSREWTGEWESRKERERDGQYMWYKRLHQNNNNKSIMILNNFTTYHSFEVIPFDGIWNNYSIL